MEAARLVRRIDDPARQLAPALRALLAAVELRRVRRLALRSFGALGHVIGVDATGERSDLLHFEGAARLRHEPAALPALAVAALFQRHVLPFTELVDGRVAGAVAGGARLAAARPHDGGGAAARADRLLRVVAARRVVPPRERQPAGALLAPRPAVVVRPLLAARRLRREVVATRPHPGHHVRRALVRRRRRRLVTPIRVRRHPATVRPQPVPLALRPPLLVRVDAAFGDGDGRVGDPRPRLEIDLAELGGAPEPALPPSVPLRLLPLLELLVVLLLRRLLHGRLSAFATTLDSGAGVGGNGDHGGAAAASSSPIRRGGVPSTKGLPSPGAATAATAAAAVPPTAAGASFAPVRRPSRAATLHRQTGSLCQPRRPAAAAGAAAVAPPRPNESRRPQRRRPHSRCRCRRRRPPQRRSRRRRRRRSPSRCPWTPLASAPATLR